MRPSVFIRVDGSSEIGLGHITRCLALAHMLKNDWSIVFVCISIPETEKELIFSYGYDCIKIDSEAVFINKISENEVVVIDGYNFGSNYQKQIKAKGAILICIDDLHNKEYYADLIINHAPDIKASQYIAQPFTQYALGLDYALLRPAFLEAARNNKRKDAEVCKALICFGGADPKNLSKYVYDLVTNSKHFEEIIIITGAAYPFSQELEAHLAQQSDVKWYKALSEQKILELMQYADVAFVPASGILIEVLALGGLAVSGYYVENQKDIYSGFKNIGAIVDAGNFTKEDFEHKNVFKEIINHNKTQHLIDGNSDRRLNKLFKTLYFNRNVVLRKAVSQDLEITFKWATDKKIRAFSFNKQEILIEEHRNWFLKKIADESCLYYIAEAFGAPIGSVRFDLKRDIAVISYLIDSKFHGKGLGQIMLTKGIEEIKVLKSNLNLNKIIGFVEINNISSIKIFENLNFLQIKESTQYKFEQNI